MFSLVCSDYAALDVFAEQIKNGLGVNRVHQNFSSGFGFECD
jgi:hypothetical protein